MTIARWEGKSVNAPRHSKRVRSSIASSSHEKFGRKKGREKARSALRFPSPEERTGFAPSSTSD